VAFKALMVVTALFTTTMVKITHFLRLWFVFMRINNKTADTNISGVGPD
jgi:hypothetical protein